LKKNRQQADSQADKTSRHTEKLWLTASRSLSNFAKVSTLVIQDYLVYA